MTEPLTIINPASSPAPRGYSNGVLASAGGKQLFIAGQFAWDTRGQIVSSDFIEQFDQALANVITIVTEAGGTPQQLARLVIYVTDKNEYRAAQHELGRRWRARMGKHYPAMTLVEVKGLLEDTAKVEIEGIAVI